MIVWLLNKKRPRRWSTGGKWSRFMMAFYLRQIVLVAAWRNGINADPAAPLARTLPGRQAVGDQRWRGHGAKGGDKLIIESLSVGAFAINYLNQAISFAKVRRRRSVIDAKLVI